MAVSRPLLFVLVFASIGGSYLLSQTSASGCVSGTYKQGDVKTCVTHIESLMKNISFTGTANSTYDSTTTTAVKSYQKRFGLKQDGIVNANTWKALCLPEMIDPTASSAPDAAYKAANCESLRASSSLYKTPVSIPSENTGASSFVKRDEVASRLSALFGLKASTKNHFTDDNGNKYEASINAFAAAGITRGCNPPTNTKFCPGDYATRGQMMAFFNRSTGSWKEPTKDYFNDDNGHIFEHDINTMAENKITYGCAVNKFCPDNFVTVDQLNSFMARSVDDL